MSNEVNIPSSIDDGDWYEKELSTAELGDKRLNKRLVKVASSLSSNSSAPINQACGDWQSTKAAYRFFDNDKVTPDKLLQPHIDNTVARMANHKIVLAVQDTTTLNYDSHYSLVLGNIGQKEVSGLMQHNTLAVSTDGLPLGLIDQTCWSRSLDDEVILDKKKRTIEEKESFKWIAALRNTQSRCSHATKVVTVCDREADIYEFFDEAKSLNTDVLVRLKHDRQIEESAENIKAYLASKAVVTEYEISVPKKRNEYKQRTAQVSLRYAPITITAPKHIASTINHAEINLYGIYIEEIAPPEGIKPIQWYLLTSIPVLSVEQAMEKVVWYKHRWLVEVYHKVEKSCCSIEGCCLETPERLQRFLALKSIIAWRVMFITYIARQQPKAPATVILAPTEIKVLEAITNKGKVKPRVIKNVQQAVKAIASLGGYLHRKSDKDPGVITICRGIQRLHDFTDGFVTAQYLAKQNLTCG